MPARETSVRAGLWEEKLKYCRRRERKKRRNRKQGSFRMKSHLTPFFINFMIHKGLN
jgi:hypothetical protein